MASYHPALDARVKCELCDSRVTREKMDRHLRLMHGPGNLTCGYCKTEFQDRESLVEHITTCTAKKKRKPYKKGRELAECDLCQKVMQRASLRLHKAVKHKGLRPVCEHCGRSFGNSIRLHEHYRAKHGYEKFKCGRCDYQSASELAMQNHERRHRGEKPFVCEECGARFHAAYLLAQHKRGHTTEKPVKCDQCPSSFKSNNSLLTHKQTCHSDRSYVCLVCARAYRCRHYAVKHSRAVHRLRGPPPIARGDLGSVGGTLETAT
ncbi:zinc finger protein 501-like [Ostrinia nubilalis]|uniref:zinc finger protein 501-like n=1 Tax=Ostrinia nubilalis TaxID=29057 RepID=UPI0030824F61